jgi:AraC-like DNA-binding protein
MQIHEHRSELGRWRVAHRRAHPELRTFVRGYLTSSSHLPAPVRERQLPSTEIPLIINFGAPHRRLDPSEPKRWTAQDGAWIVGLQNRHQLSEAAGTRHFMVVGFTPLGAHLFFRMPMQMIAGQAVQLSALNAQLEDLIMNRIAGARTWPDRFDAMERLIAERVTQVRLPESVVLAWRQLEAADGRIGVSRLASECGCSHRTLIAQFRTCTGVTPKTMARLLRFNRAMRLLNACSRGGGAETANQPYIEPGLPRDAPHPVIRWAELASDCGYFDQSHFINEFRQFSGTSPVEFLRLTAGAS